MTVTLQYEYIVPLQYTNYINLKNIGNINIPKMVTLQNTVKCNIQNIS